MPLTVRGAGRAVPWWASGSIWRSPLRHGQRDTICDASWCPLEPPWRS